MSSDVDTRPLSARATRATGLRLARKTTTAEDIPQKKRCGVENVAGVSARSIDRQLRDRAIDGDIRDMHDWRAGAVMPVGEIRRSSIADRSGDRFRYGGTRRRADCSVARDRDRGTPSAARIDTTSPPM